MWQHLIKQPANSMSLKITQLLRSHPHSQRHAALRVLFSTNSNDGDSNGDSGSVPINHTNRGSHAHSKNIHKLDKSQHSKKNAKRVWLPPSAPDNDNDNNNERNSSLPPPPDVLPMYWNKSIDETDMSSMQGVLERVGMQERQGGRMRQRKLGVLREDPQEDMRLLIENYTVPSLASALRDREDVLQLCATLLADQKIDELSVILRPFEEKYVELRRQKEMDLDLSKGFDSSTLEVLRKGLNRMPRRVVHAHQRRAGVVLPLCNVDGVPCVLFEKRSAKLRAHADEVCLPGGMVSTSFDRSIVATCLREMHEEIGGLEERNITTLGVLRCNWGEVHHLVGVAVTPVVCYIGEIGHLDLRPNEDEVAECFTVPLSLFLDRERWVRRPDFAPIFTGGPHIVWGLTGYILNRFVKDVLARYRVQCPPEPSKWLP
jgi:8-oxo-dGTP pyrophosphatase MutT (NUDIX family)